MATDDRYYKFWWVVTWAVVGALGGMMYYTHSLQRNTIQTLQSIQECVCMTG